MQYKQLLPYEEMNKILHSVHVERFGEPRDDSEMEEINENYVLQIFFTKTSLLSRHFIYMIFFFFF